MQLLIDGATSPLPAWFGEMAAENPPATVGDFLARLLRDVVAPKGRWIESVQAAGPADRLNLTRCVSITTTALESASKPLAANTSTLLSDARRIHDESAGVIRAMTVLRPTVVEEIIGDLNRFWEAAEDGVTTLEHMGKLPRRIDLTDLELRLRRLDESISSGKSAGIADAIEGLGDVGEQWGKVIAEAVGSVKVGAN